MLTRTGDWPAAEVDRGRPDLGIVASMLFHCTLHWAHHVVDLALSRSRVVRGPAMREEGQRGGGPGRAGAMCCGWVSTSPQVCPMPVGKRLTACHSTESRPG